MSDEEGPGGKEWTQAEIDLVVSDYFDMRAKFLRGERFVKARHYEAIVEQTGRVKRSVEFKYMNISATLERLGLPWVKGYAPARNFQRALLLSVEKFVEREWNADLPERPAIGFADPEPLYVDEAPALGTPPASRDSELERIARRFDPALRDERNRKLGRAGEERVFHSERLRLEHAGRSDLARKVDWVSDRLGDGAGYDILSFDTDGTERFLEVKTTIGHQRTPFFLSRNERDFAEEAAERFRIFRLHDWGHAPRAFLIKPPLESHLILEPTAYRASLGLAGTQAGQGE